MNKSGKFKKENQLEYTIENIIVSNADAVPIFVETFEKDDFKLKREKLLKQKATKLQLMICEMLSLEEKIMWLKKSVWLNNYHVEIPKEVFMLWLIFYKL